MLYILENDEKQASWQTMYEATYKQVLTKMRFPFTIVNISASYKIEDMKQDDFLWVMHYRDLMLPAVSKTKAKVLFRMSGTSENPCTYMVDRKQELYAFENVIDINMTFSPRVTAIMQRAYPDVRFECIGFPIQVDPLPLIKRVPKRIIVGGRIDPAKQFYLATFLLSDALKEGYEVFFCYPDIDYGIDWPNFYRLDNFIEKGFQFKCLNRQDWLLFLATGDIAFSCSIDDIACVSAVESVEMGLYPIFPRMPNDKMPLFDEYVSLGYEPYSRYSVNYMLADRPKITINNEWYDPMKWGSRFIEMLRREEMK